ncbi:MAG: glycosyltransferase family 39 protein [Candidatus Diapherotrites archaeon]|nr:glycosyltransferase family 39 protein [Candidatus Diapherotrites archaeon]
MRKLKREHLIIVILLVVLTVGFYLRFIPVNENHFWDECVYLLNAEVIWTGSAPYQELNYRPPLISILISPFWDNPTIALAIVATLSSLLVVSTFLLGRELYDWKTGLIAGSIVAFSSYQINLSHLILTGLPAVSLVVFSLYLLVKGHEKTAVFAGIIGGLAVLMRFNSIIIYPVFFLFFFFQKIDFKTLVNSVIGSLIVIIPYLIWAQSTLGFFGEPFIVATTAVVTEPVLDPTFYLRALFEVSGVVVIVGLLLYLVNKHFEGSDAILLLWAALFLAIMTIIPHKEVRYVIPAVTPMILIASKGFSSFLHKNWRGAIITIMLLLCVFCPLLITPSWVHEFWGPTLTKGVAGYISKDMPSGYVIYSNFEYPVLAYYSQRKTFAILPYDERFYENFPKNMPFPGWFVLYKSVNRHPNEKFLNSDQHFTRLKDFDEVMVIYQYQPE